MPNFFQGLLFVIMIFALCVALAIIIKLVCLWLEEKRNTSLPKSQEPTIYLVKQTKSVSTVKKRKKRSPKIAFEGLILKPEQVSFSQDQKDDNSLKSENKITF